MKTTRIFWSIMIMLVVASMLFVACAPAASEEPMEEPMEEPAAEEPAAEEPATEEPAAEEPAAAAGPKTLVMGVSDFNFPIRGWTIDTDDAFAMSNFGMVETLVKVDFDGNMVPNLAESWSQVDGNTWQFNLRQGVSFSNGEPFNADAVVKALTYITTSPTPPRGINADTFSSIEATDEYTVVIQTAVEDTLVPNRLTSPNTSILAPSAYIADSGPIDPYNTATGPFILTEEVPEQSVTLVKNPNYWGGTVNLDEVTVLLVPDPQIRAGMLQTGEIDIDMALPIEQLPVLETISEITVLRTPTPRTTTLDLNMSRPPFDDLRVRQAVAYALDKQAITDATLEGAGSPAVGPISPSEVWVNSDLQGYPYNPDKARQLLSEAGYEEGDLTVGLWTYPARAHLPLTALAIQNMLGDVGVNVEIRIGQYAPMESEVLSGNYDMFIVSRNHVLDNYDPEGFFSSDYSCDGGYNRELFCDETFDSLLAQARGMTDVNARYDIYRQLQSILVDEQAVGVFLNYTDIVNGIRSNVLNFQNHPLNQFTLTAELDIAR